MSTDSTLSLQMDERLAAVIADYLQDVEEGRPPDRDQFLSRHPEFAEELREFFADCDLTQSCFDRLQFVVPDRIGDDRLLEVIGSGAFGVVVKARDVNLDKLVAIKLLRGEQWSSPEYVRRFQIEARKQAGLDHPNIVPVNSVGSHDGQHYFVMRLIDGGSLTQHLCRCLPQERSTRQYQRWAAQLMAKVAEAVHYAHQHAIIHRDLKPGNILLDAAGQPHVTDFGLAKQLEDDEQPVQITESEGRSTPAKRFAWEGGPEADTVMTQQGVVVGTAPYMSPEQAAVRQLATTSDIYSLGVVLYEMLTGKVPIRGATPKETIRLIQEVRPLPPRSVNPSIDHRLEKICMKCLEREPQDRYSSASQLASDLERWRNDEPLRGIRDGFVQRCLLWFRRSPAVAGLLVTSILLLVLVAVITNRNAQVEVLRRETEQQAREERLVASLIPSNDFSNAAHLELAHRYLQSAAESASVGAAGQAIGKYRQGIAILEQLVDRRTDAVLRDEVAGAYHILGELCRQTGEEAEAKQAFAKALASYRRGRPEPDRDVEQAVQRGAALAALERWEDAADSYDRAIRSLQHVPAGELQVQDRWHLYFLALRGRSATLHELGRRSESRIDAVRAMELFARHDAQSQTIGPSGGEPLLWGFDPQGGAPFASYQDPERTRNLVGFEVDLARALARELKRPLAPKECAWPRLFEGLEQGEFDIAMNGLEVMPHRLQQYRFSRPYYVYRLQLVVRADEQRFGNLEECREHENSIIGVLQNTAAEWHLDQLKIAKQSYSTQQESYIALLLKHIDGVLCDTPGASYHVSNYRQLRLADEPVEAGCYAIAVLPENEALLSDINAALQRLLESGELRRIYQDWGLWNPDQESLTDFSDALEASGQLGPATDQRTR